MAKCRFAVYRVLVVLVALYGVMSPCICADHAASTAGAAVCSHCAARDAGATGEKIASHHRCCGMERAPMMVEGASSPAPLSTAGVGVSLVMSVFANPDFQIASLTPTHAPPGDLPIYLTTQRFLI